jgi:hypothetical protein
MWKVVVKAVISTIIVAVIVLCLYNSLGYERTELLAFSALIGLSIAALKAH